MPWSSQGPYLRCYTKEKKRNDDFPPPQTTKQISAAIWNWGGGGRCSSATFKSRKCNPSLQPAPSKAGICGFQMKGKMTKQGTGHRQMSRQGAFFVLRGTGVGPSSFSLYQWKDESVDAYDRLKAQICQSEEIWFFSEEIRLIYRIQKDWASHRLMCKTDLTLTQATEILKKICEMEIHFTIKCKFRMGTAEADIPGDIVRKRDKEIPRAKRYRKLKQSQIIKLEIQKANFTSHHSQIKILCCSCNKLYTNRKIKPENA